MQYRPVSAVLFHWLHKRHAACGWRSYTRHCPSQSNLYEVCKRPLDFAPCPSNPLCVCPQIQWLPLKKARKLTTTNYWRQETYCVTLKGSKNLNWNFHQKKGNRKRSLRKFLEWMKPWQIKIMLQCRHFRTGKLYLISYPVIRLSLLNEGCILRLQNRLEINLGWCPDRIISTDKQTQK